MEVNCSKCGTENWLENQSRCIACGSILRRCIDCAHYNPVRELCRAKSAEIDRHEAEEPSVLSTSTTCHGYACTHSIQPPQPRSQRH